MDRKSVEWWPKETSLLKIVKISKLVAVFYQEVGYLIRILSTDLAVDFT